MLDGTELTVYTKKCIRNGDIMGVPDRGMFAGKGRYGNLLIKFKVQKLSIPVEAALQWASIQKIVI